MPTSNQNKEMAARAAMWSAIAACLKKFEKLIDIVIEQEEEK